MPATEKCVLPSTFARNRARAGDFSRQLMRILRRNVRKGYRRKYCNQSKDILTEGIPLGAIQIPGDGDSIISFVDHQTTGGYPKIANVIAADFHKVGQLKPGDKFLFKLVSIKEAETLYFKQERYLEI